MAPILEFVCRLWETRAAERNAQHISRRASSSLFFLFDAVADDVGHIGIAFFLLFDEGGIVKALVHLDLVLFARDGAFGTRLLALLLGLGILERDEFGIRRLRHDRFGLRHWRSTRGRCRRRFGPVSYTHL